MLTPCKKLYYAIEAVLYIACFSKERPISSRDIAREQNLPPRHLEQIMQRLVHGGILVGLRGPKGGYQLAKPAHLVTLGQVCAILQEEDIINTLPATTRLGDTVIRPLWRLLASDMQAELEQISVADLLRQTERSPAHTGKMMEFAP